MAIQLEEMNHILRIEKERLEIEREFIIGGVPRSSTEPNEEDSSKKRKRTEN
jgi:hypothetical protein